jgi:methylthioribose-1-phosphate isomerase
MIKKIKDVGSIDPELPLLARPAWIEKNRLKILDETLLPDKIKFIYARNYEEASHAIIHMKTRAMGQFYVVLEVMRLTAFKMRKSTSNEIISALNKARKKLGKARPTANLKKMADTIFKHALWAKGKGLNISEAINEKVEQLLEGIKERRLKWAKVASTLVKDGNTILTHCNMSGMMVLLARQCRSERKEVKFIVTETRPYLQGARESAWELSMEGFDTTIISDNAAGYVIWKGMIDLVIVGADRCAMNGDVANKIGTYLIALAAFENNVPFYVAAHPDPDIKRGKEIPIEERNPEELFYIKNARIAPEGAKGYNPVFDITPAKYITGIIRHSGVFSIKDIKNAK